MIPDGPSCEKNHSDKLPSAGAPAEEGNMHTGYYRKLLLRMLYLGNPGLITHALLLAEMPKQENAFLLSWDFGYILAAAEISFHVGGLLLVF